MAKIGTIEGFIGKYIYFCNIAANVIASFALHFRSSGSRVIPSGREHSGVLIGHGKDTVGGWVIRKPTKPRTSLSRKIFSGEVGEVNSVLLRWAA